MISGTIYDSDKKIWSGNDAPSIYNPDSSLGRIILHSMNVIPNKVAQISANNGIQLTFNELRDQTIRAAQNLEKFNFNQNDIFGFISKNNHELAPIIFAALCLGNSINTIDPNFTKTEISHIFQITKPKVIFCDIEILDTVKGSLGDENSCSKIFTFGGSKVGTIAVSELFESTGREKQFQPTIVNSESNAAFIVCSSGTTGPQKAVCISHKNLINQIDAFSYLNSNDICLTFSTLYWVSGVWLLLYGTIAQCTRIITTDNYSPELLLSLIEKYKLTNLILSSYQLIATVKHNSITNRDLSSIRLLIAGGNKVPYDPIVEFKKYVSNAIIAVAYGMSEVGGLVSLNLNDIDKDIVGQILPGMKVKITNDNGQRLNVNEIGEICVKKQSPFIGYFNNFQATEELHDQEGFICTGDVGRFDEDGNLYIVGRKKEFLRYRNYIIPPSEIEDIILQLSDVKMACVFGIDDYESGDLPAVAIIKIENSQIDEKYVYDYIAQQCADSRKLRGGVYFVDSLPTTPSGKILRREMKRLVTEWNSTKKY